MVSVVELLNKTLKKIWRNNTLVNNVLTVSLLISYMLTLSWFMLNTRILMPTSIKHANFQHYVAVKLFLEPYNHLLIENWICKQKNIFPMLRMYKVEFLRLWLNVGKLSKITLMSTRNVLVGLIPSFFSSCCFISFIWYKRGICCVVVHLAIA